MKAYFVSNQKQATGFTSYFPPLDVRPILVIANELSEVAKAYPNAFEIKEVDCKEVFVVKSLVVKEQP